MIPQKRKNTEKNVNLQQAIDLTVEKTEDKKMISQRLHNQRSAYKQTSKRHKRQTNTPQQDTREKEKIRQPAPTSSFCNNPSTKLYTFPFTQPLWFASLLPSCSPPLPPSFTHHL
jgi:hypothetical protein